MRLKKRGVGIVVFAFIFIYSLANVQAVIGISPGSYEVDFKPNLKQNFRFNIIGDDSMKFKLFAEGDLAEYVTISPRSLDKPGSVQISLSLPESVELPGENVIYINAKQQPAGGGGGIQLLGNVKGIIKVRVPYPEEFATASITATSANAGKPIDLRVTVNNLGTKDIFTKINVDILDSNNRSVTSIPLGGKEIPSLSSETMKTQLNTEGYLPGYYRARVIVQYGEDRVADAETIFRLGQFFVNITGHSNDFNRDVLNRFDIGVESFWSDPIEKVYANISIINYSQIDFVTSYIDLQGFQASTLSGYFDTTGIEEDRFSARIVVNYGNKTTEKVVALQFKKEKNKLMYSLIGILAASIVVLILVWMMARRMRNGKHKKR